MRPQHGETCAGGIVASLQRRDLETMLVSLHRVNHKARAPHLTWCPEQCPSASLSRIGPRNVTTPSAAITPIHSRAVFRVEEMHHTGAGPRSHKRGSKVRHHALSGRSSYRMCQRPPRRHTFVAGRSKRILLQELQELQIVQCDFARPHQHMASM